MVVRAALAVLAMVFPLYTAAQAQTQGDGMVSWTPSVQKPYAGKYEARIGGSRESERQKLRLDIGGSVDIFSFNDVEPETRDNPLSVPDVRATSSTSLTTIGADFFTWTRLRAAGGFKFPVEAVDYYFGLNAARHYAACVVSDIRLRVAHISAHLVDGDPSFTDPARQYITYSREFVDGMIALNGMQLLGAYRVNNKGFRPYAGAMWLFHTIPDTLGVITPYAGIDGFLQLTDGGTPITLKAGYEARLNTELAPIGEHLARLGVKIGTYYSNGITVEGTYFSGRSFYGQHFSERERFFSLGFSVEM